MGAPASARGRLTDKTVVRAGGSIATILFNPWSNNMLTGLTPFVVTPLAFATPGAPVPFQDSVTHLDLPEVFTPSGQPVFPSGQPASSVAPNTRDGARPERTKRRHRTWQRIAAPEFIEYRGVSEVDGMKYGWTLDRTGLLFKRRSLCELKCTANVEPSWGHSFGEL